MQTTTDLELLVEFDKLVRITTKASLRRRNAIEAELARRSQAASSVRDEVPA